MHSTRELIDILYADVSGGCKQEKRHDYDIRIKLINQFISLHCEKIRVFCYKTVLKGNENPSVVSTSTINPSNNRIRTVNERTSGLVISGLSQVSVRKTISGESKLR